MKGSHDMVNVHHERLVIDQGLWLDRMTPPMM
jgi:hypothetical protein